ncbi:hypothetical protein, conserved [Eimeria tenella]|uniref:Uncharacterized protein n=1 Tax=Eimeria tenella TaxID=5802 RepID=U6KXG1_EIMTE|nr:hypothetical protein, conserved [Eimeria tenella]CDJ42847.1 hypothetical protein, conserved [Eimeria tenella]|eukprot:XP_013233597.1 hypothetical protein, conserved [Eimeria tenella]
MAPRLSAALFAAFGLLLLPFEDCSSKGLLLLLAEAAGINGGDLRGGGGAKGGSGEAGGNGGGPGPGGPGSGSGSGKDGDGESGEEGKNAQKNGPNKQGGRGNNGRGPPGPPGGQKNPPRRQQDQSLAQALPLLWNAAANTAAASDESSDLEDYNAALARIFEKRMAFHPRFRGALEDINEALSRDLLETNTKMPMSERQKILYGLGGRGTYLEVPQLLHELREEADHPVEERRRIQGLHRLRRRGVQINVEELKKRPFVRKEFTGPVTTEDYEEDLTDADLHQRQSALNGWLQMQNRARVLQKQHMRHRRNVGSSEPVNDDDFQVELEDLEGLGFGGRLSDVEGGEYGEQYREFLEEEGKPLDNEEEAA